MDLRARKMVSNFDQPKTDLYSGAGIVRNNNYLINESATSSAAKFAGNRLRRLQSYQV